VVGNEKENEYSFGGGVKRDGDVQKGGRKFSYHQKRGSQEKKKGGKQ